MTLSTEARLTKGNLWATIEYCRCPRGTRHRWRRAGSLKGDFLFVASCGRTMLLRNVKAPVGPWSYVPVPGTRREVRFDDAFPLRLLGPDDSRMPEPPPLSSEGIWLLAVAEDDQGTIGCEEPAGATQKEDGSESPPLTAPGADPRLRSP